MERADGEGDGEGGGRRGTTSKSKIESVTQMDLLCKIYEAT